MVRPGRTIWQCGPKFDYATSRVTPGVEPPAALRASIDQMLQGVPFRQIIWAQAIYNEYQRSAPNQHRQTAWEGFKEARHPWIQVNAQRPMAYLLKRLLTLDLAGGQLRTQIADFIDQNEQTVMDGKSIGQWIQELDEETRDKNTDNGSVTGCGVGRWKFR